MASIGDALKEAARFDEGRKPKPRRTTAGGIKRYTPPTMNYSYSGQPTYKYEGQTGALPEYQLLRDKVEQRSREKTGEATSAINRRFAAMGGLQSGAAIKTTEKARHAVESEGAERLGQIDVAELAEKRRRDEVGEGREFASEEAERQRGFQAKMTGMELGQNRGLKLAALDIAEKELRLNAEIAEFNKGISEAEANKPSGLFSWLFG